MLNIDIKADLSLPVTEVAHNPNPNETQKNTTGKSQNSARVLRIPVHAGDLRNESNNKIHTNFKIRRDCGVET